MNDRDRRLIEDYLPIRAVSAEASREKSVRKGHISTLHLWWARRPLVACRAAVYGALVPADQFEPTNGPPEKRKSLARANAAKFIERLCKYPGNPQVIEEAEKRILEAHVRRLTEEIGKKFTREDIEQGRAPRPKVLDMFAGGGSIPLEALRLGCEAYALELNPVAHIIELCTLVYPQKYGKPDPNVRGMTGPKNEKGQSTWGGLANEVRYWGNWVLEEVRREIGDLYPLIPDPEYKGERPEIEFKNGHWVEKGTTANAIEEWAGTDKEIPRGYLTPAAYLWTRTVQCENPACDARVPLVRTTWLCKKKGRSVALRTIASKGGKEVSFSVVASSRQKELGFDPSLGSKGGNAVCPFCGTVIGDSYVRKQGIDQNVTYQLMAVACNRFGDTGKFYVSPHELDNAPIPELEMTEQRINQVCIEANLSIPAEPINPLRPSPWTRGVSGVTKHGVLKWSDMFTSRQLLLLLTISKNILVSNKKMPEMGYAESRDYAISAYLALILDKIADYGSSFCRWINQTEAVAGTFSRQALAMVWDFAEINPLGKSGSNFESVIEKICTVILDNAISDYGANITRGSATSLPWPEAVFDAVITDPPYYDNVPYADASDFFYVWMKRLIGYRFPEHFSAILAPKKTEITALSSRYDGDMSKATREYEKLMAESFTQAYRVLKKGAPLVVIYAHKITLGWSSLIEAVRRSGFMVSEAWPLNTERSARLLAIESAALASSIFIVARKRDRSDVGLYEEGVYPELQHIIRERVETFWEMGITGADLVISAVGAGLRAFTRFGKVEYANGEEVPAERFLAEVETVVLETILKRLSKEVGTHGNRFSLEGLDPATRFYILWRYTYKYSVLDAGEAIVFANGTHVELDGPHGLSTGARALLEKKVRQYRLKDFSDRGGDKKLGLMREDGQPVPMIDALHRVLWLMENRPGELPGFLQEAQPNREQMRLVAQALAGPALKGGELGDISPHVELSVLKKLTANWNSVIEGASLTPREKEAKDAGQISWLK